MAAKIRVQDLNLYYGEFQALTDVNIRIRARTSRRSSARPAAASPRCCAASTG